MDAIHLWHQPKKQKIMKITVQDGEFIHIFDDSVNNTVQDGMLQECYTDVHQAIDAVLLLLCNFYSMKDIAEDIKDGRYSIMDALIKKPVPDETTSTL